ncbi:TonB family protein [Paraburkholderia megapolitana]|uniref:TonB family protein n=1 Tax=Paraburkholderia megapolitana TaxID=420953 RepID=UPI0038B91DFC
MKQRVLGGVILALGLAVLTACTSDRPSVPDSATIVRLCRERLGQSGQPAPDSLDQLTRPQWSRYTGCLISTNLRIASRDRAGYPESIVSVRFAPDGSVASAQLLHSTGDAAWDTLAAQAIAAAAPLPHAPTGQPVTRIDLRFASRPRLGLSTETHWSAHTCTTVGSATSCN